MIQGDPYQPRSDFGKWMDDRLPIWRFVADHVNAYPTPNNLNYWWTFGGILTFCLGVQIVTGILLAMHYTPHIDFAFESVQHIMRDVNYGWLLRFAHANGAALFFLAVYIHIFRSLYYGSYKAPREILWILGVAIYILMIVTAFTGYVLPWGQMSFWAATVISNLLGAFPLVGDAVREWLWGGFSVDNPTLNRFFSLHYLLPFIIVAVVVLHIWALHVVRNNNPQGVEVRPGPDTVPFHPYYTLKDAFALSLFAILFAWFIFFDPDVMGHPDNNIQANPLSTPEHIVPEWYLLPPYAILRAIPWKLGGVLAMFGSLFILFLVPWLDRSAVRSARYRPLYRFFFVIFVATCLGLGWLGGQPAEGVYILWARVLTLYYFGFFLVIMPVLGKIEKPRLVPESIARPVLSSTEAGSV